MFALYVYGKFVGCAKPRDLLVLNISPLADHSCFIKESYRFRDATFHIFYPAYAYKVQLLVYNDLTLWDSEEEQSSGFCYAIVNYRYKHRPFLFYHVSKTQNYCSLKGLSVRCPDLEYELKDPHERLKLAYSQSLSVALDRALTERNQRFLDSVNDSIRERVDAIEESVTRTVRNDPTRNFQSQPIRAPPLRLSHLSNEIVIRS
ncbi:hypothetical protein TpMuguga_04g00188 [Theileria parva strain Muguga]|uniref:uncharacterized protein n=1 Tax=Theileria parva strain Muguga TaxID=333668 RepID=UPI001C61A58B|nr:uncharacterized protein TpMuguga_04g00188 [Theileria parva strain Muguga]EAN31540.2 hypothetical protein TpMuguga_04g00188 [Theileria parva strain Muguga]